jgi:hypothetical protein
VAIGLGLVGITVAYYISKLLKLQKEDELTYFNLQRYMKHHFHKVDASA